MYSLEELKGILRSLMGANFQQKSEQAGEILKVIEASEENQRLPLFVFLLKNFSLVEENDEIMRGRRMSEERFREISKKLKGDITQLLELCLKKNFSEEEFARRFWAFLSPLKEEEKSVGLALLLHSPGVPYRQIPEELEEPKFSPGEIQKIISGGETEHELKEEMAVIQNVVKRKNLLLPVVLLLWNLINRHDLEIIRFSLFAFLLRKVEEEVKREITTDFSGFLKNFFDLDG